MRILVISDLPQFVTGGAEKQAANLIEEWLNAGHTVSCFGRRMGRGPVQLGPHQIPVHRIHVVQGFGRALRGLSYLCSLAWLLLRYRRRFDVIYTRFLGEAALTASLLKKLRLLNAKLVSTPANTGGQGSDMQFLASLPGRRQIIQLLDTQCDAINLIAPAMADELRLAGFSGRNFAHIPNGVSIREMPASTAIRPHHFLAVGRVARQKGYDILIDALARLDNQPPRGLVRIAGDGPEWDALQIRAKSLGVDHAVDWLGELDHAGVLREMEQAKIFLLPSRYEGMSNAGLEAMEHGLAMLVSRCGGLDTYIEPNMGWIVEPADTAGLATAMQSALDASAETIADMGSRNRTFALQQFSLKQVASRYLALFESLMAAATGRRAT